MAERVVCQLPLPLCLIFSFAAPFLLDNPFVKELNNMLQARLAFSFYYLKNQPITLFGTRMKDVPNFWVIMDNGYVYIFMTFGIVAFVLFCAGYAMLIAKYSGIWGCRQKAGYGKKTGRSGIGEEEGDGGRFLEEEKLQELAIIFSFLAVWDYGTVYFQCLYESVAVVSGRGTVWGLQGRKANGKQMGEPGAWRPAMDLLWGDRMHSRRCVSCNRSGNGVHKSTVGFFDVRGCMECRNQKWKMGKIRRKP